IGSMRPSAFFYFCNCQTSVAVKRCLLDSGERCYVEYDSAAKLAQEQGVPLQDIYLAAQLAQKNIN
uniref:hypothetical protein n=1 Tax=Phascolarctobacterium succinatutens TaxID=626940 RepID=UPI0026EDD68D